VSSRHENYDQFTTQEPKERSGKAIAQ